ncbi:MAG: N-acetylmuramoyl-L-alanine amidase family protein [Candidatus Dependentiae bacterium]
MNIKFFLPMLLMTIGLTKAASISMEKIMHHKNVEQKNLLESPLELGKLVFYFNQMPEIKKNSQHTSVTDIQTVEYFFPNVEINPSLNDMITDSKKNHGLYYAITVTPTKKPERGLLLTIKYDPKKIMIQHDQFVAISMQKGIVFYFYNKLLLDNLKDKDEKILQTAWRSDKKKMPIIIDCGHGGQDAGAISADGLMEKEVVLAIGKDVADKLGHKGYLVELTRTSDQTVALDERTTFANTKQALLLVSIHANFALNQNASGLETFFFDPLIMQSVSNCDNKIINKFKKDISKQSSYLSSCLHEQVFNVLKTKNPVLVDRKVKKAVSQILLGAIMPSALIEVGFLSHPLESKLLQDPHYLSLISEGISKGIVTYLENFL